MQIPSSTLLRADHDNVTHPLTHTPFRTIRFIHTLNRNPARAEQWAPIANELPIKISGRRVQQLSVDQSVPYIPITGVNLRLEPHPLMGRTFLSNWVRRRAWPSRIYSCAHSTRLSRLEFFARDSRDIEWPQSDWLAAPAHHFEWMERHDPPLSSLPSEAVINDLRAKEFPNSTVCPCEWLCTSISFVCGQRVLGRFGLMKCSCRMHLKSEQVPLGFVSAT